MQQPDQQEQIQQQGKQGHASPDQQRFTFQQWSRPAAKGFTFRLLQVEQPFFGGFIALFRFGTQGSVEAVIDPAGYIRTIATGWSRLAEAWMLEGFNFSLGVMPGKQKIQRHACAVEILLRAGGDAGKGFRSDITGRTG